MSDGLTVRMDDALMGAMTDETDNVQTDGDFTGILFR